MSKKTLITLAVAAVVVVAGAANIYGAITISSSDVPVAIPDLGSTTSTLSFTVTGTVTKATVQFSVTHTWDDDVQIQLTGPAAGPVMLMQNCGGSSDNFTNTVIDDAGAVANCAGGTAGQAPYTGTFQAMQGATPTANPTALTAFNGGTSGGTWTLTAADDSSVCTGTLTAWSLTLAGAPPLPVELQNFNVD